MKQPGALDAKCENCHTSVSQIEAHLAHGDDLDCKACHIRHVLSCTNCHFPTMLEEHKKVAMPKTGWVFLMNYDGKVTSANMQTHVVQDDKTFMLFAPQNSHSVMKEGRQCEDCHATGIVKLVENGELDLTRLEESELLQTMGVIPVLEGVKYNFVYHNYDNGNWVPIADAAVPMVHYAGYGEPLSQEQFTAMATVQGVGSVVRCDFNEDKRVDIADVIALILFMRDNPGDMKGDFNKDGLLGIADAISMIERLHESSCPETSALLASDNTRSSGIEILGLSPEDIEYIEQMMAQMHLTPEQEAAFRLALYGDSGPARLPKVFALEQNLPNPFNPATTISYSVPEGAPVQVTLKVYDIRGRLACTLVDGTRDAGTYNALWNGTDAAGRSLSSGVYLYRLQAGNFTRTRKMVLLK